MSNKIVTLTATSENPETGNPIDVTVKFDISDFTVDQVIEVTETSEGGNFKIWFENELNTRKMNKILEGIDFLEIYRDGKYESAHRTKY